jgi:hypothetical protein
MTATEIIDIVKAAVRPYLTILYATAIAGLAIALGIKFADKELALVATGALFGAGTTVMAYWFAGRQVNNAQTSTTNP